MEKPRVNMTPLIDVVFLLLTFFVMTFRIIVPEGDFNVQMSPAGQAKPDEITEEPVQVRLLADAEGGLSAIQLDGKNIENFDVLRQRVSAISMTNHDLEVILYPDDHLQYDYLVRAMSAVNGELLQDGQIRQICTKIKFARQK